MKFTKKIIWAATICTAVITAIGFIKNESKDQIKENSDDGFNNELIKDTIKQEIISNL